jgi:hypothetical protein
MTQKTHDPEDLVKVMEELRAELSPDIPADLVAAIVRAEIEHFDARVEARRVIDREVEGTLTNQS